MTALATSPHRPLNIVSDHDALAAAWLLGYHSPATRGAYASDLRHWAGWLDGRDPLTVTRLDADLYARALSERLAPSTVARRLSAVSSFYDYLVEEDILGRSPFRRVRRPAARSDSPTLGLSGLELAAILHAAEADPRAHALLCLLGLNGLRVSEALGADVGDVGTERGHRTLRVVRKGGRRAVVPLAPRTCSAVDELLELRVIGPLFRTSTGGRLDRRAAHRLVQRYAGDGFSPHSLRHTFVTLALDAGAALRDVQDAAGHADPRTTRRYDRGRYALDRNPTYLVAASIS